MISNYIIECGYPFTSFSLPPALHECLSLAIDDSRCKEIAEFLIKKGFDVNRQDPIEWLTPLHVAVKYQLVETIQYLLSEGSFFRTEFKIVFVLTFLFFRTMQVLTLMLWRKMI